MVVHRLMLSFRVLEIVVCLIVHAINIGLNTSNAIPDSYASNGNGKLGFILTHF
jgi:hypothetical protein